MDLWLITYLILVIVSLVTVITLLLDIRLTLKKPYTKRYITVEKCYSCNYTITRPFEEGDYVGAVGKHTCPKCGRQMIIDAIYLKVDEDVRKFILTPRADKKASSKEDKTQQSQEK